MGCSGSSDGKGAAFEIPQKVTPQQQEERKKQLEKFRECYQFEFNDWAPPHLKGIPVRELDLAECARVVEVFRTLDTNRAKMGFNIALDTFHDIFKPDTDPYQDYLDMLPGNMTFHGYKRNVPRVVKTWRNDDEFALQRLQGFNPFVIHRLKVPLANFPITDQHVEGVFPPGQTVDSMMAAGRLYVCDYAHLDRCPVKDGLHQFWTAPIALFFVNDDKKLMPAAIQLQQNPANSPIITPKDNAWLVAKIYTQLADVGTHELYWHLTSTHLIPELVYVSGKRQLAETHPVQELLTAHFWFTLAVNYAAREVLVSDDGEVPRMFPIGNEGMKHLVRTTTKGFNWRLYDPRYNVSRRDMDDMPNYYFKDDAYALWDIIEKYIAEFVKSVYETEEDIAKDYELQAWAKEVREVGRFEGLPITSDGRFAYRDDLSYFLTTLVFNVTAMHAATNNGQFDHMGFVPNTPATFTCPLPDTPSRVYTDEEIVRNMPKAKASILQVGLMATLSIPAEDGHRIGQYRSEWMDGREKTRRLADGFRKDLAALSTKIQDRNRSIPVPYVYLDPAQVANGVDI